MRSEERDSLGRRLLRRGVRWVLKRPGTEPLRRLASAAYWNPHSRYRKLASRLFWGREIIPWRGIRAAVNPGELHGYYVYFLEYEPLEITRCVELCSSARSFVDVGANIGLVSLAVARAWPAVRVTAFEPDRDVAARFRENVELNKDLGPRVQLVEAAVGEREGVGLFAPSGDPTNAGVGRLLEEASAGESYSVRVTTLARFFGDGTARPDVVKIDVEGGELSVLRGMRALRAQPKAIMLETHGFYYGRGAAEFNEAIVRELQLMGYAKLLHLGDGWRELSSPGDLGTRTHVLALGSS